MSRGRISAAVAAAALSVGVASLPAMSTAGASVGGPAPAAHSLAENRGLTEKAMRSIAAAARRAPESFVKAHSAFALPRVTASTSASVSDPTGDNGSGFDPAVTSSTP